MSFNLIYVFLICKSVSSKYHDVLISVKPIFYTILIPSYIKSISPYWLDNFSSLEKKLNTFLCN